MQIIIQRDYSFLGTTQNSCALTGLADALARLFITVAARAVTLQPTVLSVRATLTRRVTLRARPAHRAVEETRARLMVAQTLLGARALLRALGAPRAGGTRQRAVVAVVAGLAQALAVL